MSDVFISYAHGDSVLAEMLAKRLKIAGLSVWLDSNVLIGGEEFRAQIQQQVADARVVLLLLSKHSQRSTSVQEELIRALESGDPKRVVPVLLDDQAELNVVWPLVADRVAVRGGSTDAILEKAISATIVVARGPRETARRARRVTLFASTIVAVLGLVASLSTLYYGKLSEAQRIRYTVQVFDATTSIGLGAAVVSLSVGNSAFSVQTDELGRAIFILEKNAAGQRATITARKPGFREINVVSVVPTDTGFANIRVDPLAPPAPEPVKTNPSRVKETKIFRSGQMLSGSRKDFSQWYELCSGELPRGSLIEADNFSLSGDRSCGAWADCRERRDKRTDTRVCWEFRMQGHDEWPASGQALSEGVLSITISRPSE